MVSRHFLRWMVLGVLVLAVPRATAQTNPTLVFMTDFGVRDDAIAICKGVMWSIEPNLRIVDLTHDVTAFDVREGAVYLAQTAPYYPDDAVFVGVVDPGVGTERRAIVLRTARGQLFVAPDNGLLSLVARQEGVDGIWNVTNPAFMLPNPSATFHGRDVFSPCGAHLAAGKPVEEVGSALAEMVSIPIVDAQRFEDRLVGDVTLLDKSFGNVWTNITRDMVTDLLENGLTDSAGGPVRLQVAFGPAPEDDPSLRRTPVILQLVETFGDVTKGSPLAYFNSRDHLSFAVNMGSFAASHDIVPGTRVEVRRAPK